MRHYLSLYNYSFSSLDTKPLLALSANDCKFCKSVKENVAEVRSKGRHVLGGNLVVQAAIASPGRVTDGLIVVTKVDQEAGRTVDATGATTTVISPATGIALDAAVRWDGHGWIFLDASIKSHR